MLKRSPRAIRNPLFCLALLLIASALVLTPASASEADATAAAHDATSAFEALKSMEGTWKGTVSADGEEPRETTVTYRVSAAGHSVIQTFAPGSPFEMFSVYHMDGDELLMTHYCAIGNAPKMKFEPSGKAGELPFAFAGGTNFDPEKDCPCSRGHHDSDRP